MIRTVYDVFVKLAIAILLVLSLWLVGNGAIKETSGSIQFGTLMDTVIAISNALMALAALFAAKEAKKWFHQKNMLNNLDSAHQKIKNYEDILWSAHSRIFIDTAVRANLKNDIQNKTITVEEAKLKVNSLLSLKITTDLDDLSLLYSEQARIQRYGIRLTQDFKTVIDRIISKRSEYLDLHYEYLVYLYAQYADPNQNEIPNRLDDLQKAKIELAKEYELVISITSLEKHYDLSKLH
ncbi:hypothetical protein QFZ44_001992 [Pantoea agglomerans]|uniref:hypothetical protein n=1 Tax=Enterobacter agglomerans TaxID=549 RepID=UPI00278833D8|nr:hypothetical protein [Pantoea agglomerans]MDQ0629416.1 hypothetical protein [Pantoea agglomerans]